MNLNRIGEATIVLPNRPRLVAGACVTSSLPLRRRAALPLPTRRIHDRWRVNA